MLGKKLLTEEEYQDCDVFGLTEHYNKKYYLYHEHAEIIKELLVALLLKNGLKILK